MTLFSLAIERRIASVGPDMQAQYLERKCKPDIGLDRVSAEIIMLWFRQNVNANANLYAGTLLC